MYRRSSADAASDRHVKNGGHLYFLFWHGIFVDNRIDAYIIVLFLY